MKIKEDDEYRMAIGAIDIFTKVATVIAVPNKQPETFLKALKQISNNGEAEDNHGRRRGRVK